MQENLDCEVRNQGSRWIDRPAVACRPRQQSVEAASDMIVRFLDVPTLLQPLPGDSNDAGDTPRQLELPQELILLQDKHGIVRCASDSVARLLGYRIEELAGHPFAALLHAESAPLLAAPDAQEDTPLRLRHRDGHAVPVELCCHDLAPECGGEPLILSIGHDLQSWDRIRTCLSDMARRYQLLFNGIEDTLLMLAPDGRLLDINRAGTRLLGYARADLYGRDIASLFPITEREDVQACIAALSEHGYARYPDGQLVTRSGEAVAIDMVGSVVPFDGHPTVLVVVRDMRQHQQAQDALRASVEHFRGLAEHIREVFWISDPQLHDILYVSPAFNDVWKMSRREAGDNPQLWKDSVLPEDRTLLGAFLEAQARGEKAEVELRIRRPDGEVRWLWGRSFPWLDTDGRARVAGIAEDITLRKQEEQRRLEREELQREALVREVHHRIKNSLQGVTGLLSRYARLHPELATALTDAIAQVNSIALIHDLQSRTNGAPVLLDALVPMMARSVKSLFETQVDIEVRSRFDERIQLAEKETVPLAIIINELLVNAVKYRHTDGSDALTIDLHGNTARATLRLRNRGQLPAQFDLHEGAGLGQGLELVRALLPAKSARLDIRQDGDWVQTTLDIAHPVIHSCASEERIQP